MKDSEIYKAYIEAMSPGGGGASVLSKRLKMTRSQLYRVVDRVRNGNPAKVKACVNMGRLECVWEHMYRSRYEALPKNRKPATISELRAIIHGMEADNFPVKMIARLLKKNRSTVIHHLSHHE